jgi:plastocyanin
MKISAIALGVLLGVAMLFAAACGGGDDDSSSAATSTPASTATVSSSSGSSGTTGSSGAAGSSGAVNGSEASVELVAKDLKFDKDEITLKANTETTVTLDNKDNGVLHNFSIYKSSDAAESEFKGDLTTGPATTDYTVPALPAGTYYFRCDVHPDTMNGTVTVS